LPVEQVSLTDVEGSPEGLLHWSTVGVDFGARSSSYQCFRRAIKGDPFANTCYPNLTDPLKLEFRQKWQLRNNFQFTSEKKVITLSHAKSEEDEGEYMTRGQLAVDLGLLAYPNDCPERTEILTQIGNYFDKALEIGGRFVQDNTWLKATQVLRVKRLLKSSCTKSWMEVAERSSTVNLWEHHMAQSKAKRNRA
jgi:hypothetical protein